MAIQGQVGDQLLELPIFLLELPEPTEFSDTHPGKFPLPAIKRLLADPEFAADLKHRRASFCLAQRVRDLLFRKGRFAHFVHLLLCEHSTVIGGPTFWGGSTLHGCVTECLKLG
jgi:hypothetical protein